MASKTGNIAVDPTVVLKAKKDRVSQIDEILRKTAPSVTVIKEQVEKDALESVKDLSTGDLIDYLWEEIPEGSETDQAFTVRLYDELIALAKSVREARDAFIENAVKAEIAKRQTSSDATKLEKLKEERTRIATEYETIRNAATMLGLSTDGFGDLERAPKITLSAGSKRSSSSSDNSRMIYTIEGLGDFHALSQVAFRATQGINGSQTKLNTDEFCKLVAEKCEGADARKNDFTVTIEFMSKDGKAVKRTKTVTGKRVEIPADAPAATD